MNAMLDPRMVAASTHGLDLSAHGAPELPDRSAASSQGCFMHSLDAESIASDSGIKTILLIGGRIGDAKAVTTSRHRHEPVFLKSNESKCCPSKRN
jgi:hypothetical protein